MWSSGSGNDTSASKVVEMPLPLAQRRLVHSFVITLAFVKVKFIMVKICITTVLLFSQPCTNTSASKKNSKSMVLTARSYLREKLIRKDTTSNLQWVQIQEYAR